MPGESALAQRRFSSAGPSVGKLLERAEEEVEVEKEEEVPLETKSIPGGEEEEQEQEGQRRRPTTTVKFSGSASSAATTRKEQPLESRAKDALELTQFI